MGEGRILVEKSWGQATEFGVSEGIRELCGVCGQGRGRLNSGALQRGVGDRPGGGWVMH